MFGPRGRALKFCLIYHQNLKYFLMRSPQVLKVVCNFWKAIHNDTPVIWKGTSFYLVGWCWRNNSYVCCMAGKLMPPPGNKHSLLSLHYTLLQYSQPFYLVLLLLLSFSFSLSLSLFLFSIFITQIYTLSLTLSLSLSLSFSPSLSLSLSLSLSFVRLPSHVIDY